MRKYIKFDEVVTLHMKPKMLSKYDFYIFVTKTTWIHCPYMRNNWNLANFFKKKKKKTNIYLIIWLIIWYLYVQYRKIQVNGISSETPRGKQTSACICTWNLRIQLFSHKFCARTINYFLITFLRHTSICKQVYYFWRG